MNVLSMVVARLVRGHDLYLHMSTSWYGEVDVLTVLRKSCYM